MSETGKETVVITLDPTEQISHFEDIIRCIYKTPLLTPIEDLLPVLLLADKYRVLKAIQIIAKKFKDIDMDVPTACAFLNLPEALHHYDTVHKFLLTPASLFITSSFSSAESILNDPSKYLEFKSLSPEGFLHFLTNENLTTDSENTIFYLFYQWLKHSESDRKQHISRILPHIRLHQMSKNYLLDSIPHFESQYPHLASLIRPLYTRSLECLLVGERRMVRICNEGGRPGGPAAPQDSPPPPGLFPSPGAPASPSPAPLRPSAPQQMLFTKRKAIHDEITLRFAWQGEGKLKSRACVVQGYEFTFLMEEREGRVVLSCWCGSAALPPHFFVGIKVVLILGSEDEMRRVFEIGGDVDGVENNCLTVTLDYSLLAEFAEFERKEHFINAVFYVQ
eukprot:TRINITY_DN4855_c0_g1_i2.p1 TRINITY_DN4855_c0_g1~~TRINITY_DN4855_c0_g1_i2.p1  ORF type:complete len:461 (-),score=120.37 TRINITY_DN4855_c0_g1_i2:107-1285(-)